MSLLRWGLGVVNPTKAPPKWQAGQQGHCQAEEEDDCPRGFSAELEFGYRPSRVWAGEVERGAALRAQLPIVPADTDGPVDERRKRKRHHVHTASERSQYSKKKSSSSRLRRRMFRKTSRYHNPALAHVVVVRKVTRSSSFGEFCGSWGPKSQTLTKIHRGTCSA